jgi:hypothetical protein
VLRNLHANWTSSLHGIIYRLHQHISNCAGWDGADYPFCWNSRLLLHGQSRIFTLVCGENTDIIVGDEINYVIFIFPSLPAPALIRTFPQYAGFLTIILVIEIAIAASMYTYKDHLADGLQKGLNQSIRNYGPDFVMKSADFDAMQENVNLT